jgi:small subunit ribosomal protein S1
VSADAESGAQSYTSPAPEAAGTLATDEALQALRDKLTGA